ncbi:MAG: hypothetical protein KF809_09610 [Chloroflexi bacterium]|nr:hypothetical protein [Chloroflexota bacterium]
MTTDRLATDDATMAHLARWLHDDLDSLAMPPALVERVAREVSRTSERRIPGSLLRRRGAALGGSEARPSASRLLYLVPVVAMTVLAIVIGARWVTIGSGGPATGGGVLLVASGSPAPTVVDGSPPTKAATDPSPTVVSAPSPSASAMPAPTRPPRHVALPYPDGCGAYALSPARCAYITRWAAEQVGLDQADDVTFELLGDPGCPDDPDCVVARISQFIVRVQVTNVDGATGEASVFCGFSGWSSYLCTEQPVIEPHSPTMLGGYGDSRVCRRSSRRPCATPVPTIRPRAAAAAVPLRIDTLSIPIDRVGRYEVVVGEATLPNGILSKATFSVADRVPSELLVTREGVWLSLESLDGGNSFDNIYEHGWRPGTERVQVMLTFEVESFTPGATLEVKDLTVR